MIDLVERDGDRVSDTRRMRMPSGAGHDAQMLARVCPTSMIFVPSVTACRTTSPSTPSLVDIEAGANVLLQVMLELAERGD